MAFYLALLLLFQGCVIYRGPISLDEAVKQQKKVRVKTQSNQEFKFKMIRRIDKEYIGIPLKLTDGNQNIKLNEEHIDWVKIHDKKASTLWSILTPILVIGGILGIIAITYEPKPITLVFPSPGF